MKNLLLAIVLCFTTISIAQNIQRTLIEGVVIVEGNDIEGITIYNTNAKEGTVTNENGNFTIAAALNDQLEIRALEYKNISVLINNAIMATKKMSVFLIEEINELEEVVVTRNKLTGNMSADIKQIKTFTPKSNLLYFGISNDAEENNESDYSSTLNNPSMDKQGQAMVNGLNIVNIVDQLLIPLFRAEVKDKKAAGVPEVPAEAIKYYLGSTFLSKNFDIPEHRVEEFIRYVEDDATFNFDLLNYGNEMEFIALLSVKSESFLKNKS